MRDRLLSIIDLSILLPEGSDRQFAVQNADLQLHAGETVCVVGESGSGKSLTARAVGLPAPHVRVGSGKIIFVTDITQVSDERLRKLEAADIDDISGAYDLNPVMSIGDQIDEVFRYHVTMSKKERLKSQLNYWRMLIFQIRPRSSTPIRTNCQWSETARDDCRGACAGAEFSADEPTTALDVTNWRKSRIDQDMQQGLDTGVLFITHDFGVVADIADRVVVIEVILLKRANRS